MKKNFLYLILLISILPLFGNNKIDAPSRLLDAENDYLNNIHRYYKNDPLFFKSYDIKKVTNIINLLTQRIRIIKYDITPDNISEKRKSLIIPFMIFWIPMGMIAIYFEYLKRYDLLSKKFSLIKVPLSLLQNLSSTHFTPKENRYLKKFKVNTIEVEHNYFWHSQETKKIENIINNLSIRDKEKLTYSAINYAIKKHRHELKSNIIYGTFLFLFINIAVFIDQIADVYIAFFPHILANQLKKDIELCNVLKKYRDSLSF